MYNISKAECDSDLENGCLQESDGGQYTAENALAILERGWGGEMRHVETREGYFVHYEKEENKWLRDKLKL